MNKKPIPVATVVVLMILLVACGSGTNALRDTAWELESLNGVAVLAGTTITLEFTGDQISGSAGCNTYGGSYQAGARSLSWSDLFFTEMACLDPGVMEQESEYLTALGEVASYQVTAGRLEMFDGMGVLVLAFVAQ